MQFFNLHTHKFTNQADVLEIVNQYPQEFKDNISHYSIGIHPWFIVENELNTDLKLIECKLQDENCLALGECGLDRRIKIPFDLQQFIFEKQLALAEEYQKPIIIHCVAAFQEIIEIKKKLNITVPMLIHGFSKNEKIAQQLIDNGFYLSFGKNLVQNSESKPIFQSIPEDKFFLETDTMEQKIQEVYTFAAKYKNVDVSIIQKIIAENYKKVFKK